MFKRYLILFVIINNILSYSYSIAEEETQLEKVTVVDEPIEDLESSKYPSASVTIINAEEFKDEFKTTTELLDKTVGLDIRDFGGLGKLSTVSIRGSSSEQVLVLLDGVRINSAQGGGVDLSNLPLDNISRIEVIRGGASALYGADALGGVINIITKTPTIKPLTNASLTYGSYDTFEASVSRQEKLNRLDYVLSTIYQSTKGDFEYENERLDQTEKRENNDLSLIDLLTKFDWEFSKNTNISLTNDFLYADKGIPGSIEFPTPEAREKDTRNLATIKFDKRGLFLNDLDIKMNGYYRYDRLEYDDSNPSFGAEDEISEDYKNYAYGSSIGLDYLLGKNQSLTMSSELRQEELDNEDFGNPSRTTFSMYLQDEIIILDQRLSLSPIIRFENNSDFGEKYVPKFGVLYSPYNFLTLKGNIGKSYRAPSFNELYFPFEGYVAGNPDLRPEEALEYDIGCILTNKISSFENPPPLTPPPSRGRVRVGKFSYSFEVAYFTRNVKDLIQFIRGGNFIYRPQNINEALISGVETTLEINPWNFLSLTTNYSYLDAIDKSGEPNSDGKQLVSTPRNKLNSRLTLKNSWGKIFGEVQFTDKLYLDRSNNTSLDNRTTFDIGASLDFLMHYTASFEIKNVGDERFYDSRYFPLPGRSYFLTLSGKF